MSMSKKRSNFMLGVSTFVIQNIFYFILFYWLQAVEIGDWHYSLICVILLIFRSTLSRCMIFLCYMDYVHNKSERHNKFLSSIRQICFCIIFLNRSDVQVKSQFVKVVDIYNAHVTDHCNYSHNFTQPRVKGTSEINYCYYDQLTIFPFFWKWLCQNVVWSFWIFLRQQNEQN